MVSSRARMLALAAGILLGFAGAVLAGRQAAGYSKPDRFRRFHPNLSLESHFYPPFSMLENVALARWQPGRTLVIVGGNSVFHGVGQPADEVWTLRLQEQLGDRYVVVNLAFRGAFPSEAGALVAEALLRRGLPVIYVANTTPGGVVRAFEGHHRYLFWSAQTQGKLHDWPVRNEDLAFRTSIRQGEARAAWREEQLGAELDRLLGTQALWHHVAYRYFGTVWSPLLGAQSWRPRDSLPDPEPPPPPPAQRFRADASEEMAIIRTIGRDATEPDGQGGWRAESYRLRSAGDDIEKTFPPSLRPRMIIVLSQNCPVYRERLTAEERQRDDLAFAAYARLWQEHGIASLVAGADYAPEDFRDRVHLAPSGGHKLAAALADAIRRLPPPAP